ncbi:MAG: NlpC/P60 family protein [Armatimonadota bacterium]|nr:NlpC/P60 family protein [Armatimonadota bacterium]
MLSLTLSKRRSRVAPLLLAGSLAALPLATFAANAHQAQLAAHNARLAKLQTAQKAHQSAHEAHLAAQTAQHQAHVAKAQAAHQARLAKTQVRLAQRQRNTQARLALARQKMGARLAKLHAQHLALTSGNVVAAAYSLRGTRYVMGGTSRSGFDCSGFVRYILNATGGVEIPRTASEQYWRGTPVATQDLQPGDLVFFKNTYKHGISHVGLYAGNGKFIHAANAHKGVRMDDLNSSYYQAHFAGARRVLPEQMRAAALLPATAPRP